MSAALHFPFPIHTSHPSSTKLPKPPPKFLNFRRPSTISSSLLSPSSTLTADQSSALTCVNVLSDSLPFIQKLRGKTIVVKYGGAAMKSPLLQSSVISDIVLLSCFGLRIVLIHGGGPEINSWLSKLNIPPNFLNGLRVTDATTMEIVSMVLVGKVNKTLVALLNRAGATAVGLSGIDGRLLTARPSPHASQLGFVGDISNVDTSVLLPLVDSGHIPVIASVAADEEGQAYNINADTVAGEVAAALGAEKLILLTDVEGVLEEGRLVKRMEVRDVQKMIEKGVIGGGMIPKMNCCVRSLGKGIGSASVIDGRVEHSLLMEVLTHGGAGTLITP